MPTLEKMPGQVARLNFRLPGEVKERIENAALISGLTITDFAINALVTSADQVLETHHKRILSDRDRDIFLALLENPPAPNEALQNAIREHRRRVKE